MARMSFLAGMAAGYVLGARAGKERYEQIKGQASQLWSSPKTQKAVGQAKDTVQTQAPVVADKVTGAAKDAAGTVKQEGQSAVQDVQGQAQQSKETVQSQASSS